MNNKKQLLIGLLIFAIYCIIMVLANYTMSIAEEQGNETYEMLSGTLFGFIGIPVFSIILPLYLANKWKLNYSLWPKSKKAWYIIVFFIAYIVLTNYTSLKVLLEEQYSTKDYFIHYTSALLFHVTYYPLFVIFLFPIIRNNYGLYTGIISTAILFAFYHLTQYHFFPGGTTLRMQIVLIIAFTFNILIYLWSESIILISLLHSTNGAIGLIANGTIFNEVDFLLYLTILIISLLFIYYIFKEIRQRRLKEYNENWWIHFKEIS